MTPQDMIERYVHAVARRLPGSMRADVGAELRELIADGLSERAAGREADEKLAGDYLISLGSPASLALRYSAPTPIIEAIDARVFTKLAVGLVLALGVLAISVILSAPHASDAAWRVTAATVSNDYAQSLLEVLGFLLVVFWMLGRARRTYPGLSAWKPQALLPVSDPDRINRPGAVAALAAWSLGFVILMQPVHAFDLLWGGQAPAALRQAFAFDESFIQTRAPILWLVLGASLVLYAWAAIEGRWRKLTRQLGLALSAVLCLVSVWVIIGGDIFQSDTANQTMKFAMALIAGFTLIDIWRQFREETTDRTAPPFSAISGWR